MILEELRSKTILVVDDLEAMRKVTVQLLRNCGVKQILTARDGVEARRLLDLHTVDLVVSDLDMPGMDGLELLRGMRDEARLRGVPFMLVTAEAGRVALKEVIAAGASSVLIKPYTASRFIDGLARALAWQPPAEEPPFELDIVLESDDEDGKGATNTALRDGGVLIVDDMPATRMALSALLADQHRVRVAPDGQHALHMCQGEDAPALILLDVEMPGCDGFEVARQLREASATANLPILFLSERADEATRLAGLALGGIDLVSRHIAPEELRLRVANLARHAARQRRAEAECARLRELSQARDEADKIVRHDLKGPLSGIAGLTGLLLEQGRFSETQASYLRSIDSCVHQVMDMLSLSSSLYKIETGEFKFEPEALDLIDIMHGMMDALRGEARRRRCALNLRTPGDACLALGVAGDRLLCNSLFHNLLRNALEAAPPGTTIDIAVGMLDEHACVSIRNRGVAPVAVRERFFDKYVTAGKRGGTGLGTYSARRLVEAQGGTIEAVFNDKADSTEVVLTLPLAELAAPPTATTLRDMSRMTGEAFAAW